MFWWDHLSAGIIESHNFCLTSYAGEISHSNLANRELSNELSLLEMRRRKVALHTSSHLTPIEAWRSAVSTTSEGHRVSSEVRLENLTQVWGGQNLDSVRLTVEENSTSHLFWLFQVRPKKVAVHTFLGLAQARLIKTALVQKWSKATTFLS